MTVTSREALAACERLGVPLDVSLLRLQRAYVNYVRHDRTQGRAAACHQAASDLRLILLYSGLDEVTVRQHQQEFVRQLNNLSELFDPSDQLSSQPTISNFLEKATDGSQMANGDDERNSVPPKRQFFWGWLRGALGR